MTSLPPPLTPPECDLRDFGFMPLDVRRFRDSDLVAFEEPEAIVAAILLWAAAWHSVPAASLTDDDRSLAQLAGFGRSVKAFTKVKAGALRGFVKCSDGRLYHPVVAAKARESWKAKLRQRWNTECARIRKHNERNPGDVQATPSFEQWLQHASPAPVRQGSLPLAEEQPSVRASAPAQPVRARPSTGAKTVPEKSPSEVTRDGAECHANVTRETPSKGQGRDRDRENLETGLIESPQTPLAVAEALAAELADLGAVRLATDAARATATREVETWLATGISPDTMREAVKAFTAKATTPSRSLHRFDDHVRLRHAKAPRQSRKSPVPKPTVKPLPDDPDERLVELRQRLRARLGRTYDGWLKPGRMTLNGTGLIITMPSPFLADWVLANLSRELAEEGLALDLGSITITAAKGETL